MYDFLDKIGLKAVLEAVKGKIPTSLPANGGNADTVNNKKVEMSIYTNPNSFGVSRSDTADTIWQAIPNGSIYVDMVQNLTDTSWNFPSGVSNEHTIYIAKISKHRIAGMYLYPKTDGNIYCGFIAQDGTFNGNWRNISDDGQGYIVGKTTTAADSNICTTNHGFTPSAVFYWRSTTEFLPAVSFDSTSFRVNITQPTSVSVNYIIFK